MARDTIDEQPIDGKADLIAWIASGEKPEAAFRLGTEHEKVPFYADGLMPVPYAGERGIRSLLEGLQVLTGWEPIMEGGNPIGLADSRGGGAISLEPGGQFELSGAPLLTLHETHAETIRHLSEVKQVAEPMGCLLYTSPSPRDRG